MTSFQVPSIKDIIFSTTLHVRIYDINYGNHLGHDALVSLFHESRVRFLNANGYSELNINGLGLLITNLVVNYSNEAFYHDKLLINIGVGDIYGTRLDLLYTATNEDSKKKIASALTTIAFYNFKEKKVSPIPETFISLVSKFES